MPKISRLKRGSQGNKGYFRRAVSRFKAGWNLIRSCLAKSTRQTIDTSNLSLAQHNDFPSIDIHVDTSSKDRDSSHIPASESPELAEKRAQSILEVPPPLARTISYSASLDRDEFLACQMWITTGPRTSSLRLVMHEG